MWTLLALAFAASPDLFPLQAAVELPATGVTRIVVSPELRGAEDPHDASDLQLQRADGTVVPTASSRGDQDAETVPGARGGPEGTAALEYWPGAGDWQIDVRGRPIDGLVVVLPATPGAARVTVEESLAGAGWAPVGEQLVWRLAEGASAPIPMPARTGRFRAVIDPLGADFSADLHFEGVRGLAAARAEERIELPVAATVVQENGFVRYDIALPRPMPVRWVEVRPREPILDRVAAAGAPPGRSAPDAVDPEHRPWNTQRIQRVNLAGAKLEALRLPVSDPVRETVSVWVESQGRPPLDIPDVVVGFPRVELLVQDPGEGPFTLLAGAPAGTTWPSDLQVAAPELNRLASAEVRPGAATANPAYRPPEERSGLVDPASELDPGGWSTSWPILAPSPGLVRLPLGPGVLTTARGDLGDLRVVDDERRQIPYVLHGDGVQHDLGDLAFTRTERGKTSVLEVKLPTSDLLIGAVTLSTGAVLFERDIRISRPDRGRLAPLRAFRWSGGDRPGKVTLEVNQRLGDTLVVEIENGDDPPLPIDAVRASWPGWELVFSHPGQASLWAGNPRAARPEYDLWLVHDLEQRARATASLGPEASLSPLPVSLFDRALVLFGVAVMALGLLALTVALVRDVLRGPPKDPASDDPPSEPPQPEGAPPEPA